MGYLDNTGLTRLWSKITSKLAGYVPITRKINGKPLDLDIALTASDVGASNIGHTHDIGVTNLYVETQYFSGNNWNNLNQWEALEAGTSWSELSDDTWNELANSRWRDIVYRYKTIIPFKEYGRTGASHGIYQRINVQVGETFTFSFYAMGDDADAYIFFTDENNNDSCETSISEVHIGTLSSNVYKRYSGTTTVTKAGVLYARVENAANTWMQICGLKLEHGSIATDWGPSPDDDSTPTKVNIIVDQVLQVVYRVGSFYASVDSTNPADVLGFGTWVQIKDRFLLAAGDSYAASSTGGEATHTLTINEMPEHGHKVFTWTGGGNDSGNYTGTVINEDTNEFYTAPHGAKITHSWNSQSFMTWGTTLHDGAGDPTGSTGFSGHSFAHNNMPPYLAIYVWQRTA